MKKRVLALCLASFFSVNAFALVPPGNDVTTKPDLYYLTNAQAIDSLALAVVVPVGRRNCDPHHALSFKCVRHRQGDAHAHCLPKTESLLQPRSLDRASA